MSSIENVKIERRTGVAPWAEGGAPVNPGGGTTGTADGWPYHTSD